MVVCRTLALLVVALTLVEVGLREWFCLSDGGEGFGLTMIGHYNDIIVYEYWLVHG